MKHAFIAAAIALTAGITTAQAVELQTPTIEEEIKQQMHQQSMQSFFECGSGRAMAAKQGGTAHPETGWPDSDKVIAWIMHTCLQDYSPEYLSRIALTAEDANAAVREGAWAVLAKYLPRAVPPTAKARGHLGVKWRPARTSDANNLNMSDKEITDTGLDKYIGMLVEEVIPDSPAAKAGLQNNDLVLLYNNEPIRDRDELMSFIAQHTGADIKLTIWRNHKIVELKATIGTVSASSGQTMGAVGNSIEPPTLERGRQSWVPKSSDAQILADRGPSAGLALAKIAPTRTAGGGLVIEGDVINAGSTVRDVPRLRVALRDPAEKETQFKIIDPPTARLGPGETVHFNTFFDHPDEAATGVLVTFAPSVGNTINDMSDNPQVQNASAAEPEAAEPSRAYAEGLADRKAWEHYLSVLPGSEKEGAEWWVSHRSEPSAGCLTTLASDQYQNPKGGMLVTGCMSAKLQLDPTDKRRLAEPDYRQGWNSYTEPGSTAAARAPVGTTTPPAAEPSRAYAEGLADRQTYETWFKGLSGPIKQGAEYWDVQRSVPGASCQPTTAKQQGQWQAGCVAAKTKLDPTDKRRLAEPDYRLGWNSYAAPRLQPEPEPVAKATSPAQTGRRDTEQFLPLEGRCLGVLVLGVDRGSRCTIEYSRLQNGDAIFEVDITKTGRRPEGPDPSDPEDIVMSFGGHETGLIGGVNPLRVSGGTLSGILNVVEVEALRSRPTTTLREYGEFFSIVNKTFVQQKKNKFPRKYLVSGDGELLLKGWNVKGYCKGNIIEFGNGSWLLECTAWPSLSDTNYFRFISDGPPP